jgi:hypothetical protein
MMPLNENLPFPKTNAKLDFLHEDENPFLAG